MLRLKAFLLGVREYRLFFTTDHETDGERAAYDYGRDLARTITFQDQNHD